MFFRRQLILWLHIYLSGFPFCSQIPVLRVEAVIERLEITQISVNIDGSDHERKPPVIGIVRNQVGFGLGKILLDT